MLPWLPVDSARLQTLQDRQEYTLSAESAHGSMDVRLQASQPIWARRDAVSRGALLMPKLSHSDLTSISVLHLSFVSRRPADAGERRRNASAPAVSVMATMFLRRSRAADCADLSSCWPKALHCSCGQATQGVVRLHLCPAEARSAHGALGLGLACGAGAPAREGVWAEGWRLARDTEPNGGSSESRSTITGLGLGPGPGAKEEERAKTASNLTGVRVQ